MNPLAAATVASPAPRPRWKRVLRRVLRMCKRAALLLLAFTLAYVGAAIVLGLIPVNRDYVSAAGGVEVFVVSNGVHVDFVLPVRCAAVDWSELLPREEFGDVDASYDHVWFGWGERAFYIETPTWADVKVSVVAKAMLYPTPTAMHVVYSRFAPAAGESVKRLMLSPEEMHTLVRLIRESFQITKDGSFQRIAGASYGATDNFYEARGSYHLFNTCNMWTNRLLSETGVRTAVWSPFTLAILYHLD